ncbi:NADPH-dependent FMN reductase [Diaporthe helianthi]|uniref:NADPH-dependent FMN reductase n=1 Tax=Diaporthe helianthi TaxID=158607 RepID=A0A2P5HFP0_DIAHE|nr:NADPH-dependent FMN reductase [Diaporthe helianthi]
MATATKSVAVVITSTRGIRVGPNVASLISTVVEPAAKAANINLKTVDLKSFNLPVFSESAVPQMVKPGGAQFEQETSKAWAAEMTSHDGYIFILNEYNYGMSGAAKNAIDYLMNGFTGKPAVLVSYGVMGGKLASDQAKGVLSAMGLTVVEPRLRLAFSGGRGPEGMMAVLEGKLGDETRRDWGEGHREEILEAFEKLGEQLRVPKPEGDQLPPSEH